MTRALCSLASCTARLIALREGAEPSVGTRMFLNMGDVLLGPGNELAANHHRYGAVREHLGRLAAEQQLGDPAPAVRRHEYQVAAVAVRGLHDLEIGVITRAVGTGARHARL